MGVSDQDPYSGSRTVFTQSGVKDSPLQARAAVDSGAAREVNKSHRFAAAIRCIEGGSGAILAAHRLRAERRDLGAARTPRAGKGEFIACQALWQRHPLPRSPRRTYASL